MDVPAVFCHVCGQGRVQPLPDYGTMRRVTSDSKPWPCGGWIGACPSCGCIQKAIDSAWMAEIEQIYDGYTIYYQSGGSEQVVFVSGEASARSDRLVQCLLHDGWLADMGRLLDIGCGNGAFLGAFSRQLKGWTLAGTEINDKYRDVVEQISGVEGFYTTQPEQVPGQYDLVTMIHVLEHVPNPGELLRRLPAKLTSEGRILIEVPDYTKNPFDLLIADHCTHFTRDTLARFIRGVGYGIDAIPADWVPKELSMLAHHDPTPIVADEMNRSQLNMAQDAIRWLRGVVDSARRFSDTHQFGIFGTSIAATWLCSEIDERVSFFVDEDPKRAGRLHLGRPIYHPRDVPSGSTIFIAMPTYQAEKLKLRIEQTYTDFSLCIPDPLTVPH